MKLEGPFFRLGRVDTSGDRPHAYSEVEDVEVVDRLPDGVETTFGPVTLFSRKVNGSGLGLTTGSLGFSDGEAWYGQVGNLIRKFPPALLNLIPGVNVTFHPTSPKE